ncbi:MAG: threonine synthase [Patescibacteria group bacterium]|nr:threonine synthase [Patescibacteria group bacterium]
MGIAAFQQCIIPDCGATYDFGETITQCKKCGNLLDVQYDWNKINYPEGLRFYDTRRGNIGFIFDRSGVWRFRELLPFVNIENEQNFARQIVSLDGAEGRTNPYHTSFVAKYILGRITQGSHGNIDIVPDAKMPPREWDFAFFNFYIQFEGSNPTGSFKDNGMTAAFTHANMLGTKKAVCASTGNTSASLAAFARNSGILQGYILIGEGKIAYGKLSQGLEHGATTIQIQGDFDDAMARVQEAANRCGVYVMNSINPFRLEGQKTIMYRVLEGLNWQVPDWIICPAGNLGNGSAFGKAFIELKQLGLIGKVPRIALINAKGADTLDRLVNERGLRWNNGNPDDTVIKNYYHEMDEKKVKAHTIASAIEINRPVNLKKALRTLEFTNGIVRTVTDEEIMDAKAIIGLNGLFGCEPASAATVAGAKKMYEEGIIGLDDIVVCIATGHQLKDPIATVGYHTFGQNPETDTKLREYGINHQLFANKPIKVPNDLEKILEVMEKF